MSKLFVAALASAMALSTFVPAFAATDPTPPSAPTAQTPEQAAQAQTPAPAQPAAPATTATAAAAPKKGSPNEVICKPDSGTGSRVGGKKICLTRAEWRERDD